MDGEASVAGLDTWRDTEADVFGAAGRVTAHPRFATAARALAANMLGLAADDPVLGSIFLDAGRYVVAMWAFALHDDGGLTLPHLKAICARSGLLSPGRARALLQFLEHVGYLQRRAGGARGADIYTSTQMFLDAWDRQLLAALDAARLVAPDIALFLDPTQTALRHAFGRIHAHSMLSAMQSEAEVLSFLRVFLHPYAGNHISWTLIVSDALEFPPRRAGPVSISGLSRACGASRIQVARIFHEAAEEGLADLSPDGFVTFHAPAREQLGFFYAIQLVQILAAAAQATSRRGHAELDAS